MSSRPRTPAGISDSTGTQEGSQPKAVAKALKEIRGDLKIVLRQTKAIGQQLASQEVTDEADANEGASSTRTWVLIGIGLVIGGVLGAAYGRWQERSKRTRIRI